jgi:DNA-binding response OmpR family regulator
MTEPSARPRRWILVVDDDASVRHLMIDILQGAGYAALGAEDGFVAEELIRDLFPDMIILDLKMPRGSGWSLLDNVREHARWSSIPILIVTGLVDDGRLVRTGGLRIVGVMEKPVPMTELLAKIQEVLGPA